MKGPLLIATWAVPLAMLAACLSPRVRTRMLALLGLAPLPGLAAALLAHDAAPLVLDDSRLNLTFSLDPVAAVLLGAASLLWMIAGIYARSYMGRDPNAGRFAQWWLLTLGGSLGVFVAGDLLTFYIAFALVSLAAWGLVAHDDTRAARRAGVLYIGLAVFGEVCLLLAFALLAAYAPGYSIAIQDVVAALPENPARHYIVALLITGFGLKAGLLPLHVWLPIAHPAAPMPASAVLSGAIIKAGVIGLILFLPLDPGLSGWGTALTVIGLLTAFYAVLVGITQQNPKTVLAYSSVSQMGGVAAVLGMGLATGNATAAMAAAFLAAHHVLVKGALFLAIGVAAHSGGRRTWTLMLPAGLLALALGGLPLTGGALAKLAAKTPLGDGLVVILVTVAAAGSTLLMLHFLFRLADTRAESPTARAKAGLLVPWLLMAFLAVALPWALATTLVGVTVAQSLTLKALWVAAWPVMLGIILVLALRRFGGVLPRVPEGDIVVLGSGTARAGRVTVNLIERVERRLCDWPTAGVSLLVLTILIGAALFAGPTLFRGV
ncbi:complex I subunit 5 family protein [Ectothiorhodospira lacustris]|uniref:complex I subunit 5 family protein n=1 Tax=Ectothiorhodospira lacustris TaxID=2899127 RepID=UPI001EE8DDCA|nr:complex I subunit 5 family protein [Ectothiorhodospira lacustris]